MNRTKWHFDLNPNMGVFDKSVRYILSIALIIPILFLTAASVGWAIILPLIAIPVFGSALIGWDPIYALFQKRPTPMY